MGAFSQYMDAASFIRGVNCAGRIMAEEKGHEMEHITLMIFTTPQCQLYIQ